MDTEELPMAELARLKYLMVDHPVRTVWSLTETHAFDPDFLELVSTRHSPLFRIWKGKAYYGNAIARIKK